MPVYVNRFTLIFQIKLKTIGYDLRNRLGHLFTVMPQGNISSCLTLLFFLFIVPESDRINTQENPNETVRTPEN